MRRMDSQNSKFNMQGISLLFFYALKRISSRVQVSEIITARNMVKYYLKLTHLSSPLLLMNNQRIFHG